MGKIFVLAVRELCYAEGPKEELCKRAFVRCPGGGHSLSNAEAVGQGSCRLPDPQEHTLVFLEPGLLGAVSELLFFLFSSCLLSSMFKAVCAFIFAQLQDPFGPALSPFLAVPERGHHSLLMPPTFPPISSFVRDLWSCCKSHLSFPLSRICHPVGSTFDSSVTEKMDGAALLFKLHSKITGT